ncbi:acyltransferase [Aureimonas sp. SK2]|uniref:acyltransferase family protein n=1 Tax=Aureimonas sp. SK2 TaxID=3015992 RepID=UPI00244435B4|nr:acyltransferase [Aureimonas sp. SK2]
MIWNLQYLRGIAALMVVIFHVTDSAGRLGGTVDLPHFALGFVGVDLFFVLSGFIICVTTRSGAAGRPVSFLERRILRVVPPYWILTALLANAAVLFPGLMGSTVFEPAHALASFAFWPALHPTLDLYNPLLVVGWTLNYEMAFYALFALALVLPRRVQVPAALAALVLVALVGRILRPGGVAGFYTDPVILEFALGLVVGMIYASGLRLPRRACLAFLAAGILLMAGAEEANRLPTAGLPAAMIVLGAVFLERASGPLRLPVMGLLGDASYAIYLVHLPVLPVVQIVWRQAGIGAEGGTALLYVGAAVLACTLAGILFHLLIEAPLGRLLRPRPASASNAKPQAMPRLAA